MKDLWEVALNNSITHIIAGKTISEAVHIAVEGLDNKRLGDVLTLYDICKVDYEEFIFRTVVEKLSEIVDEQYTERTVSKVTNDIFKIKKEK